MHARELSGVPGTNEHDNLRLGEFAVALADDGTLVVGADTDDVSSSGINGAETASPPNVDYGSVYIYR